MFKGNIFEATQEEGSPSQLGEAGREEIPQSASKEGNSGRGTQSPELRARSGPGPLDKLLIGQGTAATAQLLRVLSTRAWGCDCPLASQPQLCSHLGQLSKPQFLHL